MVLATSPSSSGPAQSSWAVDTWSTIGIYGYYYSYCHALVLLKHKMSCYFILFQCDFRRTSATSAGAEADTTLSTTSATTGQRATTTGSACTQGAPPAAPAPRAPPAPPGGCVPGGPGASSFTWANSLSLPRFRSSVF